MKHYVLLKFEPGFDIDAAEKTVRKTYEDLAEALPWLTDPHVYRTCVERDSNADVMAVISLDGPEHLKPYLTHPLHLAMAEELNPHVVGRTSFDHE